jgi:hypothetical protein
MYILIKSDKSEIKPNVVAADLKLAEAPEGWEWIDDKAPVAQELLLDATKEELIESLSDRALEERRAVMPDYKLQNAALGIYDAEVTAVIKETCEKYRNEYYRVRELITKAKTTEEANAAAREANFNKL